VTGEKLPVRFDQGGTFTVIASVDGISVGSLIVHVVYIDFDGPVACQVGYKREKGVAVYGPTDQVFFTAKDPALLEVSVKEVTSYGVRLYLKALGRGTPVVQARLGSATGPILAEQELDEFILDTSAVQHLLVNGATDTANSIVTMSPWIPNLNINFAMYAHYSTFAGGATAYTLNSSDQTSVDINGDPAIDLSIDPTTGETQAVMHVDIEMPADEDSYCFAASFDQHSRYGTENGWIAVNGSRCLFRMTPIYMCEGSTNLYKLPCVASWGNRQVPTHKDSTHAHKMSAVEATKFELSPRATLWGFNCRTDSQFPDWDPYVKLTEAAKAGEKYGVKICGTTFEDVITAFKVDLIPDYDRSGKIDDDDRTKANAGDKFYFWINDDDDSGIEDDSSAGKQDIPGSVSGWLEFDGRNPDYEDDEIDGERDWVDFFPVFVDLKPTLDLIGTNGYKYVLKHTAGAVNAYIATNLGPTDAVRHLRDHTYASAHDDATVQNITATGYTLPAAFLNAVKDDGKGVILLEGRSTSTNGNLIIEVQKLDGTPIGSHELPLSLDGVEKMFLHKNLRSAGGGSGGEACRTTAPNYPDELCNGKQFVFIHGYNVNVVGARGWEAETFKRMYWSRNNARFHAITWYGDESQTWYPVWGYKCPNYHNNVVNAWETAPSVANYLADLSGDVYLAAHSLGNMVASCALSIDSGLVTKYFMLNGAVASEAFDSAQYNENMLHSNWIPYESLTDLYASAWHSMFGSGDNRADLTWQDRFNAFASKVVNFYSTGDQVFEIHAKEIEPDVFEVLPNVDSGRYSWAFQEKRKGTLENSGGDNYAFSHYAGWRFNNEEPPTGWTEYTPWYDQLPYRLIDAAAAASITTNELVTKPFFAMGAGDFRNNLFTTNTATANTWLTETNKWRILAGAIPAMSLAAGREAIPRPGVMAGNVDMNVGIKPTFWPDRDPDPNVDDYRWLHCDIKNMAYIYTFEVFDAMVSEGDLEQ
jgi:hypothetical protein